MGEDNGSDPGSIAGLIDQKKIIAICKATIGAAEATQDDIDASALETILGFLTAAASCYYASTEKPHSASPEVFGALAQGALEAIAAQAKDVDQ